MKQLVEGIAVLTGGKGRIAKGIKLFKNSPDSYLIISGVDKNIKNIDIIPKELLKIIEYLLIENQKLLLIMLKQ